MGMPLTLILAPIVLVIVLGIAIGSYLFLSARPQFGALPSGARLARIEKSPQYNRTRGQFQNKHPRDFQEEVPLLKFLKKYILGKQIGTPTAPLPSIRPDLAKFLAPGPAGTVARAIWLGHSTVLLNIEGTTILLDPTMTQRASPTSVFGLRFQDPPIALEDLPPIDFIVLSHDHYDHLDADTIRFFKSDSGRPDRTKTRIITALGVGARLESFGITPERITELDWWETHEDRGFKFIATPAQHFSGRGPGDGQKTLWVSFVIQHPSLNLFFSGDTGYADHFKTIGEKLGPFDFAILESGQYNLWWRYVHMLPEEVVQSAKDLRAKEFMPVHWGMFNLSIHDWFEPISRVFDLATKNNLKIRTPILGELLGFGNDPQKGADQHPKWWETHPDYIKRMAEEPKPERPSRR